MLHGTLATAVKFAVASIAIGAALSFFDLSASEILKKMGLTPQSIGSLFMQGVEWAVPNFVLGAMIIIPLWLVIYLLKPPGRK